jgi:hypothetical protein
MIHDARTSKILAEAKQHRANVIGDFIKVRPAYVILALAMGALTLSFGGSYLADVTTASNHAEVTNASDR